MPACCAARDACPLPAHQGIVAAYLSNLASTGRKASTIGRRCASIAWHLGRGIAHGHVDLGDGQCADRRVGEGDQIVHGWPWLVWRERGLSKHHSTTAPWLNRCIERARLMPRH
jgi:hypothetical protein